jgi:hypothetical protein
MIRFAQRFGPLLLLTFVLGAGDAPRSATDAQKDWQVLFDGKSTDGWRGLGMEGAFPTIAGRCGRGVTIAKAESEDGGPDHGAEVREFRDYFSVEVSQAGWQQRGEVSRAGEKGGWFAFGPEYQIMYDWVLIHGS